MPEGCKLYIGNLDPHAERRDLDEEFSKYGEVVDIWVARKPPGFAFVTYGDPRDAKTAVKEMDGANFLGGRIRVEVSRGGQRRPPPGDRDRSRDRGRRRSRSGQRYRSRSRSREQRYRSRSRSYDRRRRSPSYGGRGYRD